MKDDSFLSPPSPALLYHPAARGDLDLEESPFAIHLVSAAGNRLSGGWAVLCQTPGLAPLCAEPNASIIIF